MNSRPAQMTKITSSPRAALRSMGPRMSLGNHLSVHLSHAMFSSHHTIGMAWKMDAASNLSTNSSSWVCFSTGGNDGNGGSGSKKLTGGNDNGDGEGEEEKYLDEAQAAQFAAANKFNLPSEFVEAARTGGLRISIIEQYAALVSSGPMVALAARSVPFIRDRLLADPRFLFKMGAEVIIDTVCATIAEVRKRGDDFWDEFTFYVSDIVVGVVLDAALVTLIAPVAVLGAAGRVVKTPGVVGSLQKLSNSLPSAFFEKSIPGVRQYSVGQRFQGFVVKGMEYALAGVTCGFVGQGLANGLIMVQRAVSSEKGTIHADLPPVLETSLVWGAFMGISSNSRYQVVFGLERLLEALPIVKRFPQLADAGTVVVRFVNNVIGAENYIDMARFFGVQ